MHEFILGIKRREGIKLIKDDCLLQFFTKFNKKENIYNSQLSSKNSVKLIFTFLSRGEKTAMMPWGEKSYDPIF